MDTETDILKNYRNTKKQQNKILTEERKQWFVIYENRQTEEKIPNSCKKK